MAVVYLLLVLAAGVSASISEHNSHVRVTVGSESSVSYGGHRLPVYHQPTYTHQAYDYFSQSAYHPQPAYPHHPQPTYEPDVPYCAGNTTKPWCLEDVNYPSYEIKHALQYHAHNVLSLYADVSELDTALSVARPKTLADETYLCPSKTSYVKPLRAVNTDGKWRVIVNYAEVHYQTLTQTARIEECHTSGDACPLVPRCYNSKCLQKSIYHRFLIYDPYDYYFPFAIETFVLPASCACRLGAYTIDH